MARSSKSPSASSSATVLAGSTRLRIDPTTATVTEIALERSEGEVVFPSFSAGEAFAHPLFAIRFVKWDLTRRRPFGGWWEYTPSGARGASTKTTPSALTLAFADVAPSRIEKQPWMPEDLAELPKDPPKPINVMVTLASANDWIQFDISFDVPPPGGTKFAWEPTLVFPRFRLATKDGAGNPRPFTLLDPVGYVGDFATMAAENPHFQPASVSFAAVYESAAGGLQGIALAASDAIGNSKAVRYDKLSQEPSIAFHLTSSVFLKKTPYGRSTYVRPPRGFKLSEGDELGFGGARTRYWLRAFRLEAPYEGAPLDWHDVAAIYRDFFTPSTTSVPRSTAAPLVDMSPFTVVSNYSLDGPVEEKAAPDLAWKLELHPMVEGNPDFSPPDGVADDRLSIETLLSKVKSRVGGGAKLEAQIWGFEMGGFYRFLGGYPPITNVLEGPKSKRLGDALADLKQKHGIWPSVTTDPLNTNFDRTRFAGHLLPDGHGGFRAAISKPFPKLLVQTTDADATGRSFRVATVENAVELRPFVKLDFYGRRLESRDELTRFHGIQGRHLCPTKEVREKYTGIWLADLFKKQKVPLLEFMKHPPDVFHCYDGRHRHLESSASSAYNDVFGAGPWYVRQVAKLLHEARRRGRKGPGKASFALTNEFVPPESLLPYFDDYYDHDASSLRVLFDDTRSLAVLRREGEPAAGAPPRRVPLFHFVHSARLAQKMNLVDREPYHPPGYRETVRDRQALRPSAYMLSSERDDDTFPGSESALEELFAKWRAESEAAGDSLDVTPGLSAHGYRTTSKTTYSFRRVTQSAFNLRSEIFRFGVAGVTGERIYISSLWFEPPVEYDEPVVAFACRAIALQRQFKEYFRTGRMLGPVDVDLASLRAPSDLETEIRPWVFTWRARLRPFYDVSVLVDALFTGAEKESSQLELFDYVSRATDLRRPKPVNVDRKNDTGNEGESPVAAAPIRTDRIAQMAWERTENGSTRLLYAFANVGGPLQFAFDYNRGLGAAEWTGSVAVFAGSNGAPVPLVSRPETVRTGSREALDLPACSFAAVELTPANAGTAPKARRKAVRRLRRRR